MDILPQEIDYVNHKAHSSKCNEPLDNQSRAQVRELVSLFQAAQSPEFKHELEFKTTLPKELITNLLELKKERSPTQNLEYPNKTETLPPLQHNPQPVSTLPTIQSSLYSLIYQPPNFNTSLSNVTHPFHKDAHFTPMHIPDDMNTGEHSLWQDLLSISPGYSTPPQM